MTSINLLPEGIAPVPTRPASGPAIPPRMRRRPLTFAALTRRATRRATWASAEPLALPTHAIVSLAAGAVTASVLVTAVAAMCGLVVL